MRYIIKILLLLLLQSSFAQAQIDFIPKKSLSAIEQEHSTLSNFSYPNPNEFFVDSLLNNNFEYFDSLLDLAFIIKHDSFYNTRIYDLISALEKEKSEITQRHIAIELSSYDKEVLIQLDKSQCTSRSFNYWRNVIRTLVLGYETEDFIFPCNTDNMVLYATPDKVFLKHYFNLRGKYAREREYLQKKLGEYISSTSYKDHKSYYHDIAMNAFKKGILHPSYKYSVFREIIKQEVEDKNESYLNDYLTLIHEIDQNEAIDLINYIASARTNNYYPQIFLDLLSSENEDFVGQIISWSSNCWNESKCKEVKYKLYKIFENGSEKLKFKAAFVLMHDYEDLAAYNYLISIVESKESTIEDSKYTAISWLGDACNNGKSMSSRLNKALKPYLNSENERIKRATIETYLNYRSPYVIEAIIPYLDYKIEYIAKEIQERILLYEDKEFTIENLKKYLTKNKESKNHEEILSKLQK